MEEVGIFCPIWFDCVLSASGLSSENLTEGARDGNSLALATAMIAQIRNVKASAVHYRISTVMFNSGVKHDDLIRLNRLGICMSPDAILCLIKERNEQLEGKIQIWKSSIEEKRGALMLPEEVLQKQLDTTQLDVSERSLATYHNYSTAGYTALKVLLDQEKEDLDVYTTDFMQAVTGSLKSTKLPLYKCLTSKNPL